MLELSVIQKVAVWLLPVLFAITLHEAAHAWMANRLGDSTAKMLGRVTFNPIKHIDLVGTILVPIAVAVLSNFSFIFGWAKPVPINWQQLRNPRRDTAIVGAIGPLSNIFMAFLWAGILKIATFLDPVHSNIGLFLFLSGQAGIIINLILAYLNLIPIPPLDGSRVVMGFLSPKQTITYLKIERYGLFIFLLLVFSGALYYLISPPLNLTMNIIRWVFGF